MNPKTCKISKILLALPILLAALVSSGAASEPTVLSEEFRRLLYAPSPNSLEQYQLVDTLFRDAKEGEEEYFNIDIDGDDVSEIVTKGCPGSTQPSDPCMLSIRLSSSGKTMTFKTWGFFLLRYHAQIFISANADKTEKDEHLPSREVGL